jgi:muconolactone delta-isomerase
VQFLVICRPAEGGDPEDFKRLVPFETEVLRELKANGTLVDAWSPGHPGAVLVLHTADAEQAARILAELPLLEADLITTEIVPLYPIDLG